MRFAESLVGLPSLEAAGRLGQRFGNCAKTISDSLSVDCHAGAMPIGGNGANRPLARRPLGAVRQTIRPRDGAVLLRLRRSESTPGAGQGDVLAVEVHDQARPSVAQLGNADPGRLEVRVFDLTPVPAVVGLLTLPPAQHGLDHAAGAPTGPAADVLAVLAGLEAPLGGSGC